MTLVLPDNGWMHDGIFFHYFQHVYKIETVLVQQPQVSNAFFLFLIDMFLTNFIKSIHKIMSLRHILY